MNVEPRMNGHAAAVASTITVPISPLHEMLPKIGREYHAHRLNRIVNDPSIYPWVHGYATGRLDLSPAVALQGNILLMGEHGGVLFACLQPGLYEAHTQILPAGRGAWAMKAVRAMVHWMFTRTDMMELVTRCPQGNLPALALTKRMGGKFWFRREDGWVKDNDPIPADIYRLSMQDWMDTAPGLVERGQWFKRRFAEELRRHDRALTQNDDQAYERQIGLAVECALSGMVGKTMVLFNRFAAMAGFPPINIVSMTPLSLDVGGAILVFRDQDFWVATAA